MVQTEPKHNPYHLQRQERVVYWRKCLVSVWNHCKLTAGEESQIQLTLLLRLCDSVAPLVLILRRSVGKTNLYAYISQVKNIFCSFQ